MKKRIMATCCFAVLAISTPVFAEICTDFDDNLNIIEFECGTSVKDAIKKRDAEKKAKEEQVIAEEKAKRDAEKAERERIRAEEKAKRDAEEAERERIHAEEKAKRDAEKAERERIRAEEKAKRAAEEAERERIRAEEKAKRDAEEAERERIRAEERKQYWNNRRVYPYVGIAYKNTTISIADKRPDFLTGNDNIESNNIQYQLGIAFRSPKTNWEYGLRLGFNLVHAEYEDPHQRYDAKGNDYYALATLGYNILSSLSIYAGLGLRHRIIDWNWWAWDDWSSISGEIDDDTSTSVYYIFGTSYWVWNSIGIFAEARPNFHEMDPTIGIKVRF